MSEVMTDSCWVDGSSAADVAVTDRGLLYGDGVFETVRIVSGVMTLENLHYARLFQSCDRLLIPVDQTVLFEQVSGFLFGRGDGILKIMITRGSGGRGYNPSGATGRIILSWHSLPVAKTEWIDNGVEVVLCKTPLGHSPVLAGMKHMNRLEQVLARAEWQSFNIAEGLVCDVAGNLIEGTMTNLFLVRDGEISTADLSLCGVDGVMRQWLLKQCSLKQKNVSVCALTVDDLFQADEVFLTNGVIGVWSVIQCGDHQWRKGPVTRQVQQEVYSLFHV